MKRVLAVPILALASVGANAQYHHYHHRHYGGGGGWIAPALIGGVIGYAITRSPEPVIVQQPPVVVQQPPVILNTPNCTAWVEIQQPNGTIVRQRTCTQ